MYGLALIQEEWNRWKVRVDAANAAPYFIDLILERPPSALLQMLRDWSKI